MARILNPEEYEAKRSEILDITQRLVYSKGYEQMSIREILEALQISKGAFYHYFDSKSSLLEALIERITLEAQKLLTPIVSDPRLPALEKLELFFSTISSWKTARKEYLMALLRGWYADDNALARQKTTAAALQWFTPMLAEVIRQGVDEGVFSTPYPDAIGQVALGLLLSQSETLAHLLLSINEGMDDSQRADIYKQVQNIIDIYADSLERVLGAPAGSILLVSPEIMKAWVFSKESELEL